MSYDYNALVTSLASHRSQAAVARMANDSATYAEHLQEAVQVFDTLSGHCPMTPLLWMQYAYDMGELMATADMSDASSAVEAARQTRLQTLELALNEFPGSAVLQLHYCELLVSALPNSKSILNEEKETCQAVHQALVRAIQQVGSGSHRNEGDIVAQLYRVHAHFSYHHLADGPNAAMASLLQRAKTPMESANDGLRQEISHFCTQANVSQITLREEFEPTIDEARRWEAKAYSRLRPLEDEVTTAMHQEQISYSNIVDFSVPEDGEDMFVTTQPQFTDAVLKGQPPDQLQPRFWMGLGGAVTAESFLQYVAACRKFKFPKDDDATDADDNQSDSKKQQQQLVLSVLERGIAECPTVESMWLAYLKHLTWLWTNDPPNAPSPVALQRVAARAVRNCPFSLSLVQQQLHISLLLANSHKGQEESEYVLDPEDLLQMVTKALDSKFLPAPGQALDLFVTAIRVVQRRILSILATTITGLGEPIITPHHKKRQKQPPAVVAVLKFDDAEVLPSKIPKNAVVAEPATPVATLDDESWQEVQDLCEEMRDMLDAAFARLNKDHASWSEGRAMLQQERSRMEELVLAPLLSMGNDDPQSDSNGLKDSNGNANVLSHFEKVTRMHNPSHPDSYRALIQHVLHYGSSSNPTKRAPGDIVTRLRQVRGLYQKAIQSVGRSKAKEPSQTLLTATTASGLRDYETALSCLCHDYQEFERVFGSEQSLADATRQMQRKLQKTAFPQSSEPAASNSQEVAPLHVVDVDSTSTEKRKASHADDSSTADQDPPAKKRRTDMHDTVPDTDPATTPAQQSKKHHTVKIGHIFHRAHPFTVRISNLALQTEEIDIIEFFKQEHKCGAVVHCKVQREKHLHTRGPKPKASASKGWALLQFEERESVEKALQLDQNVKLQGNLLHIERSHIPAVGIVPPGMHRPKHSKQSGEENHEPSQAEVSSNDKQSSDTKTKKPSETNSTSSTFGILALRPRGVGQKKALGSNRSRPKVKLSLPPATDKNDAVAK